MSENEEDVKVIQELVDSYLENSRTIILTVVPASSDINIRDIIQRAHPFDKTRQRTVGIIIKPDLPDVINVGTEPRTARLWVLEVCSLMLLCVMVDAKNYSIYHKTRSRELPGNHNYTLFAELSHAQLQRYGGCLSSSFERGRLSSQLLYSLCTGLCRQRCQSSSKLNTGNLRQRWISMPRKHIGDWMYYS